VQICSIASVNVMSSSNRSNVPVAQSTRCASIMFSGASLHICHEATSGSASNWVSAANADVAPDSERRPRVRRTLCSARRSTAGEIASTCDGHSSTMARG